MYNEIISYLEEIEKTLIPPTKLRMGHFDNLTGVFVCNTLVTIVL